MRRLLLYCQCWSIKEPHWETSRTIRKGLWFTVVSWRQCLRLVSRARSSPAFPHCARKRGTVEKHSLANLKEASRGISQSLSADNCLSKKVRSWRDLGKSWSSPSTLGSMGAFGSTRECPTPSSLWRAWSARSWLATTCRRFRSWSTSCDYCVN